MTARRTMNAMFGAAMLLAAGSTFGDEIVVINSAPAAETLPAPLVEIAVYDGTTLPATVIAGCSEPTCMGLADGSDPTPGTGTVTHPKNYVGWSAAGAASRASVYLYVDGKKVASARSTKLLVWSVSTLGAHTVQAMTHNADGVEGWSPPVTITAM